MRAKKTIQPSALGDIPANVNMPFIFTFEQETITDAELSQTDWELAFELESKPCIRFRSILGSSVYLKQAKKLYVISWTI